MDYVQVVLQRGITQQICWVEAKEGVKVGAIAEIRSEEEGQKQGWEILEVGMRLPNATVQERSQDYKNTRKASDV